MKHSASSDENTVISSNYQVLNSALNALDCEKDELLEKIEKLKDTIQLQEKTINCKRQTDFDQEESEADSVQKSGYINEIKSLREQLEQLQDHNDSLKAEMTKQNDTKFEKELNEANLKIESLSNDNQKLVEAHDKELASLNKLINDQEKQINEVDRENEELLSKLATFKIQMTDKENEKKELKQQLLNSDKTIDKLKQQDLDFDKTVEDLNQQIKQKENEVNQYKKYWTTARDKYHQCKVDLDNTIKRDAENLNAERKHFTKIEEKQDKLESDNKSLRQKVEILNQQVLSAQYDSNNDDNDGEWQQQGSKKKNKNNNNNSPKKRTTDSNLKKSASLGGVVEDRDQLVKQIISLQAEVEKHKQEKKQAENHFQETLNNILDQQKD